ncbi:MAG: dual specificity protein phosphatase family protein [Pirellulaceae bacterium]|nr:dual specificity protein phosphatase family protein [Pirellulaceae bacterium]
MFQAALGGTAKWYVVHATHEPCYRRAVGRYASDVPQADPEYLHARRGDHLVLNLIDAPVEVDIPIELYETALQFVNDGLNAGGRVLVHCNQGVSRSASIGLLYLKRFTSVLPDGDYDAAAKWYEREIYPAFNPGKAIRYFLRNNWKQF